MLSFIRKFLSFIVYKQEASNDVLEAYPERLHVTALPERRYLKTARFLVVFSLICLTFNFALTFFYIRNASLVQAIVDDPQAPDTFLYQLDYYNKELKAVQRPEKKLDVKDLVYQNLITDYLNERYQMTNNRAEMEQRWSNAGKLFAYAPKLYESFIPEANAALAQQLKGITREIYIYSIKNLAGNMYEVIFDVFSLNESGYGAKKCPCKEKTQECLVCMRDTRVAVQRYKAYMRVTLNIKEQPAQEIRHNINPFYFTVIGYTVLPQVIRPNNQWENVDLIIH